MKQINYQKAQISYVEACTEGNVLLVASEITTLSVRSVGQDLVEEIDLSNDSYYIEWD